MELVVLALAHLNDFIESFFAGKLTLGVSFDLRLVFLVEVKSLEQVELADGADDTLSCPSITRGCLLLHQGCEL